ncbi:hypothetical protein [Myceligenerans pegani]|uniref:Serine protease n=1 Tax=Myceligenerans pegani TaxID=2776917 RepID=A0ABR9MS05_9MICO|nr:hypothetical protein [Myceligenerans sp. TRM 65318]MBE1874158.1 hypothetical protein [Myceligenerans sp. TRM 65318]MBE3016430.1 hypothetical protein [Myceligenerans sp. TRM 65318]
MERYAARKMKEQLADFARELGERYGPSVLPRPAARPRPQAAPPSVRHGDHAGAEPADSLAESVTFADDVVRAPTLALGLVPRSDGGYGIAVRYRLGLPRARAVVRRIADEVGPDADVRRTGRIRPLSELGPRRLAPTSQAEGETDHVRPLRPGVSIGHVGVTAGTLGAFVRRPGVPGELYALSNYHVLAGSPKASPGDVVLQPGPADGGLMPGDRVGELTRVARLVSGEVCATDAAIARLDSADVDHAYPVGPVVRIARPVGGETVEKVGRTTAVTRGRVTAIELDDVIVGYEDLGALSFDDQVEIEGNGAPFSRGGDSGALVYREDGTAIGLLFAGSESGGQGGKGLTYANPIDVVLETMEVELAATER